MYLNVESAAVRFAVQSEVTFAVICVYSGRNQIAIVHNLADINRIPCFIMAAR